MSLAQMPMIPKRYLHIGFHFAGAPKAAELEPIFAELSDDWIRYSHNNWIAWTKHDQVYWTERLKSNLGPFDHFLILEIKQGQPLGGILPQWIWNWLYKVRS
ncbi:MAG: hypothetical protein KDI90_05315 [Alphaproteobacteria bacterium]|nr:hypothetical protein [Alphaproteobacteria bacterium]MCB9974232.1 hypothetical protein [Rhodospirillales bacterium]